MAAEGNRDSGLLVDLAPLRVLRRQANLGIAIGNLCRAEPSEEIAPKDKPHQVSNRLPEMEAGPDGQLAEQMAILEQLAAIQHEQPVPPQAPQPFAPPHVTPAPPYVPARSDNPAIRLLRWLLRPLRRLIYGSFAGRIVYELDHNADVRIAVQTARLEHRLEELTRRQFEPIWQELRNQAEERRRRSDLWGAALAQQQELMTRLFDVMGQQVARLDSATAITSENADQLKARVARLAELQATLSQRQLVALEQATAMIVGGQSDQSARLDAVSHQVAATAELFDQSLDRLANEARVLIETVESSSQALRQELDARADRRAGEGMAKAQQMIELIAIMQTSLEEGLRLTLNQIDNLGRQQEAAGANLASTLLGQIANDIQQARNNLDQAFGNRLLDLRGAVNDGFGRLAGQISSTDAQQAKLLNAAQAGIERSLLSQQRALATLGREISNRLASEGQAHREAVREQLLAQLAAISEQGDSRWQELQSGQQQVAAAQMAAAQQMDETLDLVRNDGAARLSLLQEIVVGLEALTAAAAGEAEPVPLLPPEQLGRIERYSSASARRFALPVGDDRVLVRTEVGYMICPAGDTPLLAQLIDNGELEPGTRMLIEKLLVPGDVFIDVGANIGMHTIAAARRVGSTGAVFAIEPFATSLEAMLESAAINGLLTQIHPTQVAAWHETGEARLYLGSTSGHHSLIKHTDHLRSGPESVVVKTMPIDMVVPSDRDVTLAKFDVEGVELEALKGAGDLFDRCPDAGLIIEYGKAHLDARGIRTTAWFGEIEAMGFDQCYLIEPWTGALLPGTAAGCVAAKEANLLFLRSGSRLWERVS